MLLSALQHIFAGLKRTRDQKLSSGLMSGQLSSAITGLMLLTFTTTHLLTSRPTLRSRSPCASWAPPLHRELVRGSFPAPHHHDPNEMLPNFAFWVMVAAHSCQTVQHSDGDSLRRSLSSPFRAILGSLAVLLPYLAKGPRDPGLQFSSRLLLAHQVAYPGMSLLGSGPEFRRDRRAPYVLLELFRCGVRPCILCLEVCWRFSAQMMRLAISRIASLFVGPSVS